MKEIGLVLFVDVVLISTLLVLKGILETVMVKVLASLNSLR